MPAFSSDTSLLQVEPELFNSFVEEGSHLICVRDAQGRHLYANKPMKELYPPEVRERMVGQTMYDGFDPQSVCLLQEENRRALALGRSEIIQDLTDHTGRHRVLLSKRIAVTRLDGQPLVLGISTDITELALRERALARTNEDLASFAALAAHDLRSPLATFVGLLDLISLDQATVLSDESSEYLTLMRRSATQLADNIGGLLKTFKAGHEGKLERRQTDFNILFEQVRFNLSESIKAAEGQVLSNRLPVLDVDTGLVRHLIRNLLENALKYRLPGHPPFIVLRYEEHMGQNMFSVEDNGRGISQQEAERVFQLCDQGQEAGPGVGLGLSLCRKVVELHKGRIWVDTGLDKGCRICLTLQESEAA